MSASNVIPLGDGASVLESAVLLAIALEARGCHLGIDGDALVVNPKALLTDDDRASDSRVERGSETHRRVLRGWTARRMTGIASDAAATPWLTVEDVMARVKCGRRVVYRAVKSGKLRGAELNRRGDLRFRCEWVDAWVESLAPVEVVSHGRS
jgi:excisionase family DNA binding protein